MKTKQFHSVRSQVRTLITAAVILSSITIGTRCSEAATFTVINTSDGGAGSLRAAISNANANAGSHLINFAIPPLDGTVKTISPLTALPGLIRPVTINGYTQDTAHPNTLTNDDNALLLIELNGSSAGPQDGLFIETNCVVRGLVINRFAVNGISVNASGRDSLIEGNFIGTDPTGTIRRPNGSGLLIGGPNTIVGGTTPAARNLISGNANHGLVTGGLGVTGIGIEGNFIGTDVHGTTALGNGLIGIRIVTTTGITVGGADVGAGNVISGNGDQGVSVATADNVVQGNFIGTDLTGTLNLSNHTDGVAVNASDNTIGGAAGNVIAFNGGAGVSVSQGVPNRTNNLISVNSIFSNGALGIDLDVGGVTSNDVNDVDTGANHRQNFPVLTVATNVAAGVQIQGTLNSTASTTFRLEFFANPACDPSGSGEGEAYLGTTNVTTAANNNVGFTIVFTNSVPAGQFITATATDPDNNTSEFSACRVVDAAAPTDIIAPALVILSPADLASTTNSSVLVTGTATDPSGLASVTVNGDGATVSGTNWSLSVSLFLGTNTITVIATDNSPNHNGVIQIVHVVRTAVPTDTTAPTLVILSPADFATTTNDSVLVSGTATDDTGLGSVTVKGAAATVSGTNWSLSVSLVLGTNTIPVIATDSSANANAATQTVHVVRTAVPTDTTAPTLVILSPADFATTTNDSVLVSGTATDDTGLGSVTVKGAAATVSGTNWVLSVNLVPGTNTIAVIATDSSPNHNAATQTVHVVRNSSPPVDHAPVLVSVTVTNAVLSTNGLFVVLSGVPAVFQAVATDVDGDPITYLWNFGEGSSATDALASHTYSNCGPFSASITISDGTLSNTTPLTISVPCEFTVAKLGIKLVFSRSNADSINLSGSLPLQSSFVTTGKRCIVDVGGVTVAFVLDAKGKGTGPLGSVQLKAGKVANTWSLKVSLKNGAFAADLADDGLIDATTAGQAITLTATVVVGDESFMAHRDVTYKANQNRSGSAK